MLNNIVICSVVPEYADYTKNISLEIASKFNSKITFLICLHKSSPHLGLFQTNKEKKKDDIIRQKADKTLRKIIDESKQLNINVETRVISVESISEYILHYVETQKVDLLIVDSTPPKDVASHDHKETINRIYTNVSCPILTLK